MNSKGRPAISSSMCLHHSEAFEVSAGTGVPGGIRFMFFNDGSESFDLVAFTDDAAMASELAIAMNAIFAKYGRLSGANGAPNIPETAVAECVDDH